MTLLKQNLSDQNGGIGLQVWCLPRVSRLIGSAALLKAVCLLYFKRVPRAMGGLLRAGFTLLAGLRPFMGVAHLRRCFRDEPQNAVQSAPLHAVCGPVFIRHGCAIQLNVCARGCSLQPLLFICKLHSTTCLK